MSKGNRTRDRADYAESGAGANRVHAARREWQRLGVQESRTCRNEHEA